MRRFTLVALLIMFAFGWACAQQPNPSAPASPADAQPQRVKVYAVGPGVTAPALIPSSLQPPALDKCNKVDGEVELALLVDQAGRARNIMFLKPLGDDLDRFALQITGADRFKPGTLDGKPVVVAQTVDVKMQACLIESKDAGKTIYRLRLRSIPEQRFDNPSNPPDEAVLTYGNTSVTQSGKTAPKVERVGIHVTAPILLNVVNAEYSDAAKKAIINGTCVFSLIVDAQGMPENPQEIKRLGYGLDERAMEAVSKYRFKPAMRDGEPVPVETTVEVNFRLPTW